MIIQFLVFAMAVGFHFGNFLFFQICFGYEYIIQVSFGPFLALWEEYHIIYISYINYYHSYCYTGLPIYQPGPLSKKFRLRNQRVMFSRCNPFNIFGASSNWRRGIYAFAVDFIYGWFVPRHPRSGSIKTLRHQNFIQDIAPCEYFKFKL